MSEILTWLPHLRRFARSLCRDQGDADDLVQTAVEKAIGKQASFRGTGSYKSWIFQILYRSFLDDCARRDRQPSLGAGAGDHAPLPPSQEDRVMLRQVTALLQQLPEEQRSVLTLIAVEGLSYEEVAAITGVPVGTVMSRLHRARLRLHSLMEENRQHHLKVIS